MFRFNTQDIVIMIILLLIMAASGGDLIADMSEGVSWIHIAQEAIIMLLAFGAFVALAWHNRTKRFTIAQLKNDLETIKSVPQPANVVKVKQQLSAVIAEQFDLWALSQSEKEVGMLLLKGFSLKEISLLRGTAEKTVRQQASAIYRKANLSGRHAFSAWFIEDLL